MLVHEYKKPSLEKIEIYFKNRNGLLRSSFKINRKIREKSQSPEKHLEKIASELNANGFMSTHWPNLIRVDLWGPDLCKS